MEIEMFVKENMEKLQDKEITNITKNKIKYISDYINNWTYSVVGFDKCEIINFIDCMCNAGIYNDCTLSTSMEVLKIFVNHAKRNINKKFNLFLNDINVDRINVIKELIKIIAPDKPDNLMIFVDNMDVNNYLESINKHNDKLTINACTVLFVDPYNFGTVKIKLLYGFLNKYYSELIFNYFSSDYLRNINNLSAIPKIDNMISSLEGVPGYYSGMNETEVLELIQQYLKKTRIKHIFTYQFRTKTNTALYSIVYATPNKKGLEKIKESFWRVFDGNPFFKNNDDSKYDDTIQLRLIDDKEMNSAMYISEAIELLLKNYNNSILSYNKIVEYLLENTMLKKGQILNGVIKSLIKNGQIDKLNKCGSRDYLNDEYLIKSEGY